MRPIPIAQRNRMSEDLYYKICCLSFLGECIGRVEYHHNLIHASKQSNEQFTILPVCQGHHTIADRKDIKELLNWIMLNRGQTLELKMLSKANDYIAIRDRLNKKYGIYHG